MRERERKKRADRLRRRSRDQGRSQRRRPRRNQSQRRSQEQNRENRFSLRTLWLRSQRTSLRKLWSRSQRTSLRTLWSRSQRFPSGTLWSRSQRRLFRRVNRQRRRRTRKTISLGCFYGQEASANHLHLHRHLHLHLHHRFDHFTTTLILLLGPQVRGPANQKQIHGATLICFGATSVTIMTGLHFVFDKAAADGNCDGIRAMLSLGLDLCGGISRGVKAMGQAASKGHVEVMQILTDAGVKDTGTCFVIATQRTKRDAIRFLMKQYELDSLDHIEASTGPALLTVCIKNHDLSGFCVKLVRWLIDTGADSSKPLVCSLGTTMPGLDFGTPRMILGREIAEYSLGEVPPTLTAIDRLLQQEEAVHAKSFLWPEVEDEVQKPGSISSRIFRVSRCTASRVVVGGLLRYTCKKF